MVAPEAEMLMRAGEGGSRAAGMVAMHILQPNRILIVQEFLRTICPAAPSSALLAELGDFFFFVSIMCTECLIYQKLLLG